MSLTINPGTGPVKGGEEAVAWSLMGLFAGELQPMEIEVYRIERTAEPDKYDDNGRFRFELAARRGKVERSFDIDMPGVARAAKGEPWVSPRLYVDGSSWLWGYALSIVAGAFEIEEDG